MLLSYCVVNTNGRELLLACLDAIARTTPPELTHEVLVLDNASDDGSADAVRALGRDIRLIALDRRAGKAENDSRLLREARGRYCLLLNEDAELQENAPTALLEALEADPRAGAAACQLLAADGTPKACAWRLPGAATAVAGALFLHKRLTVQSRGDRVRPVGWAQSSAMLVRRVAAEEIGYLDTGFFVYSDETDFCKRLGDAGWRVLYVPAARAIHHDQLTTDRESARRRIVEFHRSRDRYMRKHHPLATVMLARMSWVWAYLVRAGVALLLPGEDPRRYLMHARQELAPGHGAGLREAAERRNLRRGSG